MASYVDLLLPGTEPPLGVGWWYPRPDPSYPEPVDRVAPYAGRLDEVTLDGETVIPQPGRFYGGWITSEVVGPFRGDPAARGGQGARGT